MSERPASSLRRAKVWRADPTLLSRRAAGAGGFASDTTDEDAVKVGMEESPTRFGTYDPPMPLDGFALERYPQLDQPLSALSRQAMARFDAERSAASPVSPPQADDAAADRQRQQTYVPDALLVPQAFVPVDWEPDFNPGPGVAASATPDKAEGASEAAASTDAASQAMASADGGDEAGAPSLDAATPSADADQTAVAADAEATADSAAAQADGAEHTEASDADAPDAAVTSAQDAASLEEGEPLDLSDALSASDADGALDPAAPAATTHALEAAEAAAEPSPDDATVPHDAADPAAAVPADDAAAASEPTPMDASLIELTEAALAEDELMTPANWDATEQERVDAVLAQTQVPGIDPDEVAQREAEHYARGHADGEQAARAAMAEEVATERALFANATQELKTLLNGGSQQFFEPLKRLAMHLAEHIVLHELQTSNRAIEQLVQRCIDTLDQPPQGMVTVEVNPQDKQRLQAALPESLRGMRLDAVEDMRPGSVRVFANDTIVEDLMAHRLTALARGLQIDVDAWDAQSPLLHDRAPEPESAPEVAAPATVTTVAAPEAVTEAAVDSVVAEAAEATEATSDDATASSDVASDDASLSSPDHDSTESDDVSS